MSTGVPRLPREGQTIDQAYVLGKELGRGAMGVVFSAWHEELKRKVALKMMLPRALALEGVVERFMRGAQLASALTHPNAVVIYGVGLHKPAQDLPGLPYMIMEHLDGEDLYEYIVREHRVSLEQTLDITRQALEVLADAHQRGIIHRDLKPENLFLTQDEDGKLHVKVLDFGLAKAVTEGWGQLAQRLTANGMTCGTPEYMAPEQAVGEEKVGPALDVYALGCIMYHMLTGHPPFQGNGPLAIALKHVQNAPPELPPELRAHFIAPIIRRCLAKMPRARYRDAGHLLRALEAAMGGEDPELRSDWPSQQLLQAPFRTERSSDVTDPDVDTAPVAPETLQMMPVLAEASAQPLHRPELSWLGATMQGNHELAFELAAMLSDGDTEPGRENFPDDLPPGGVQIDLEAHSREIDYSQIRSARTLITGDEGVPRLPPRPTEPISAPGRTEPMPIQAAAPSSGGQGLVWALAGLGVILLLGVLALGAAFFLPEDKPRPHPEEVQTRISVTIDSTPAGARVFVDGHSEGVTPLAITRDRDQQMSRVLLRKEGYQDAEANIHLDRDGSLNLKLEPQPIEWLEEDLGPPPEAP